MVSSVSKWLSRSATALKNIAEITGVLLNADGGWKLISEHIYRVREIAEYPEAVATEKTEPEIGGGG